MKSALDCFQSAARCEERASAVVDFTDRAIYLGLAQHWRTLGAVAQRIEKGEIKGIPIENDLPDRSHASQVAKDRRGDRPSRT